jgi:hypothetical protein
MLQEMRWALVMQMHPKQQPLQQQQQQQWMRLCNLSALTRPPRHSSSNS